MKRYKKAAVIIPVDHRIKQGTDRHKQRTDVQIPKITPSLSTIKLRKDNERLIQYCEILEDGPFKIKKFFKSLLSQFK